MSREAPYKSALRVLEVLELVGAAFNGLKLKELAFLLRTTNKGSLHAMLHLLVTKGYLIKLERPIRYVVGPSLGTINRKCILGSLHERLAPVMRSVCRQSGMKIIYQQLVAGWGFSLFQVKPETYFHVDTADFANSPYGTPVIFQAYMTPQEQDQFWAAYPMGELDRKIWGSFVNLRKYLKMAAKQRLAVIAPQHGQPFRVSGPIFDSSGKISAAISAIDVEGRFTPQQANNAAQLIYRAAVELSANSTPEILTDPAAADSLHSPDDCPAA